jgi:hypothetical protein
MRPYILDDAATLEYQRLDLMSKILDPWTRGYLAGLGVGQGWHCLELGSGNGGRDRGALYFRLFFAEVRDRVVDSGRLDAATFDAASGLLDDPDYWTQCWMMTAVWARKPVA